MSEMNPKRIGPGRPAPVGRKNVKPAQSKLAQTTSTVFFVVAISIWLAVAPRFFPKKPGGGFDFTRVLAASVVGGIAGGLGAGVGKLIERARR